MKRSLYSTLLAGLMLVLTVVACTSSGTGNPFGNTVTISIYYGSEKEAWMDVVTEQFNNQRVQTESGATIVVEATPIGSIESMRQILDGQAQPTVWSPASSIYVPLANEEWRQQTGENLTDPEPNELVLSPVVIAMW
ncbi:MAG: hypothetical protein ACFB51_06500 [Anaerolineae bacterium]